MARGGKVLTNGRNKNEQFVPLPYAMVRSEAWLSLSSGSIKVYVELRSKFNGGNNGELSLSYATARKKLHLGNSTIEKAFDELEERGFIALIKEGHWYGRKAAEWRATDRPYQGNPATNAWRRWKPGMDFRKTEAAPDTGHIHYLTVPSQKRGA
ncbi:helix-turn-helix domain-containing protein [Sneathiella chungangensis]|uniref:Helix-turn-helix domain-containing protein n=1 Tax=Sneathiella chungangensis TaxID=1418234 RepID=A0A845M9S6_9PROT|nr:helix-turn-helix domain-containing protein [Sneathiella chungangensis]MZR21208.1 helix-turn-helix domain-containing protein [Sneathiella chungangensis]